MRPLRSLLGRRQFMVGAVATSASALIGKKISGAVSPCSWPKIAAATETSGASGLLGAYRDRYANLLSPLRIGNVVLQNRMLQTPSIPRNLVGPEDISADQLIDHYAGIAGNGCGICFVEAPSDTSNETVNRYYAQMLDAIHFSGSLACTGASRSAEGPMPFPGPGGSRGEDGPPDGGMPPESGIHDGTGGVSYAIGNRATMWCGTGTASCSGKHRPGRSRSK